MLVVLPNNGKRTSILSLSGADMCERERAHPFAIDSSCVCYCAHRFLHRLISKPERFPRPSETRISFKKKKIPLFFDLYGM